MRDQQFTGILGKLIPNLDKYFHTCLINFGYKGDKNRVKQNLIHLTILEAFLNSRKVNLEGYEIEALIWLKAQNIWWSFSHPRIPLKEKYDDFDEIYDSPDKSPGILERMVVREQLARLRPMIDDETWKIIQLRAAGYSYREIAGIRNEKESKIKMTIKRLRDSLKLTLDSKPDNH